MGLFAKIDVALARDPRMIAAGPLARLLYVQSVLYARENLTDGVIDALVLPIVAIDVPNPRKHMARLVDVGALTERKGGGWIIPEHVWRRYNPTRAEVEEQRRLEAERKAQWRARRERDAGQTNTSQRDELSTRRGRPDVKSQSQRQSESQSQRESVQESSSSSESVPSALLDEAAAIVVEARCAEYKPRRPDAWRRTTFENVRNGDAGQTLSDAIAHGSSPVDAAALVIGSETAALLAASRLNHPTTNGKR